MPKSNSSAGQLHGPVNQPEDRMADWTGKAGHLLHSKTFHYALIIAAMTIVSFLPALKGEFMPTWDDEKYVTGNPMIRELSAGNIRLMFTRQVNGSYVPLPLLTFAIEYKLFGDSPLPFHATNLILHVLCTLLVFQLLRLLKLDPLYAAAGALLFGIHPMKVESVAWITERKDVLYSLFYLGSIVVYIRFVTKSPNKPRLLWYSILLFICSLFSKIEAVTLPLSLLLIDYWMRRPFSMKLIIEKIPYFLLSLFFGLAGIYIIYRVGLAVPDFLKTDSVLTFSERLFFGLYAISGYIIKFFVPYSQSAMYPYPVMTGWTALWIRFINPALLVVVVAAVWWSLRKTRAILFGILFFLVNIFFLLQIIAVGNGFFADRYTYIPYFGLAFITAWFAGEVAKKNPGGKRLVHVVMVAFILTFAVMTFSRCKVWKDGLSLWSDVISRYPGRMMEPYANRGIAYTFNHDWSHAVEDFSEALSVGPVSSGIYADRGIVYGFAGQPEMAVGDFTEAVRLDPKNAKALYNRGVTCVNMGEPGKAMSDFRKVLLLEPANVSACSGLSILYFVQKNYDTCRMMAEKGIHIDPYRPELYSVIGNCELETGDIDKAIGEFRHCLRIDNSSLDASLGLVAAFVVKGDRENAFRNMEIARQTAQEKNIALNITDIENSGVTMGDRKREAIGKVLLQKR